VKREAKLLLGKSIDSLILSIEHFNSMSDRGRTTAVLVLLDHAIEMLLKAAIVHRGGRIKEVGATETLSTKSCVNKLLTNAKIKCLTESQAALVRTINALRDAEQHYLIDVQEHLLYLNVLAGVTFVQDFLEDVFGATLAKHIPRRVLPVSSMLPKDLVSVFEDEVQELRALMLPGRRKRGEMLSRLRALAIVENALSGSETSPRDREVMSLVAHLRADGPIGQVFPNVVSTDTEISKVGLRFDLRLTKHEGLPVHIVGDETEGLPIAQKKVSDTEYYNLGLNDLAHKLGISRYEAQALVYFLRIQDDARAFKALPIFKQPTNRYSHSAVVEIQSALLSNENIKDEARRTYQSHLKDKGRQKKSRPEGPR